MITNAETDRDGRSVTVRVPLAFRRRGGRKRVASPDGEAAWAPRPTRIDSTQVKAIARAHRWQGMLEGGAFSSIGELAQAEQINPSYLARVLRLTLLAPDIVDSILDGRHDPERITLHRLMMPFPAGWDEQRQSIQSAASRPSSPFPLLDAAPRTGRSLIRGSA